MNRSPRILALLATSRVANIPSVVSNVWTGVALGVVAASTDDRSLAVPWASASWLVLAGVMLYGGGNFVNDWMDRTWDGIHRPERALPQRWFAPSCYLVTALCLLGIGILLAWMVSPSSAAAAGAIVFMIGIYTLWHKKSAWAVIPMGMCRALLPVMGFLSIYPYIDRILPISCALFGYIVALSLRARYESIGRSPQRAAWIARVLFLLTAVMVAMGNRYFYWDRLPSILAALPYLGWTACCLKCWQTPISRLVSGLLAGIPLVDWMALLPLAMTLINDTREGATSLAITSLLVPPLAFLTARLLQRLAPAT